jgi:plasmid stability protein
MTNLTITVDDEVLRRARAKAAERGTSVNAVMRDFLEHYAGQSGVGAALAEMFEIADSACASTGEAGITWTREDLHDRANLR